MSVARTASRRRRQHKLGARGLAQVFGKRHAPHYRKIDEAKSARRLREMLEKMKKMQSNKGKR